MTAINRVSELKQIEQLENDILNDEKALAILLEFGKNCRMSTAKLSGSLPLNEKELKGKVVLLDAIGFIKQNPAKDESKPFEKRRYVIDIKGMFFLNKIRKNFKDCLKGFDFFF